jgi:succinate dehydrogenase/fumarate reductase flavoprotein subunit
MLVSQANPGQQRRAMCCGGAVRSDMLSLSGPGQGLMLRDREVDVLVAGAGAAGMTAALVASLQGLDVLLCEKSGEVGGTSSTSAGTLWIPGNHQSRNAGFDDSADKAEAYLDALIGSAVNRRLRTAFLETGPIAIDYLEDNTDVKFSPCGRHPDYRSNMKGAAVAGRAIIPQAFDGRLLGSDFARVRPPIREYMVLGGMMVGKADIAPLTGRFRSLSNFSHAAKLFVRYLSDRIRYPRGTRLVMGNALTARLFFSLRKRGVNIVFNAPIVDIVRENGRVVGAKLKVEREQIEVKTRKGVVLATGGCAHNTRFREAFMPRPVPVHSLSSEFNQGDGLALGERLGARIAPDEHGHGGLWTPASVTTRADGTKGLYPHIILDRAKPGLIAVNATGRRFVNEAVSYHDFVEAMFEANAKAPSIPCHLICDAAFMESYGLGAVYPGMRNLSGLLKSGYLRRADTLESLAAQIGVDAQGLCATVARYNGFAQTGVDTDFGKGETELNRCNGDEAHEPNPCIGPVATAPYYAVEIWPADIAVSTGLSTDPDARVLDKDFQVIPGLYACGNDMASPMSGSYPGPGTTLGPGIVFAYRAAMHAAGKNPLR